MKKVIIFAKLRFTGILKVCLAPEDVIYSYVTFTPEILHK